MKKPFGWLPALIFVLFLSSCIFVTAEASKPVTSSKYFTPGYGEQNILLNDTLQAGNTLLLPVKGLLTGYGFNIGWNPQTEVLTVSKPGISFKARANSRIFTLNGGTFTAGSRLVVKDKLPYLPSDFLTNLGLNVDAQSSEDSLSISGTPDITRFGSLEALFPPSPVAGKTVKKANLYSAAAGRVKKTIPSGLAIEVLSDKSYNWYNIRTSAGDTGWVRKNDIYIDQSYIVNNDVPTKEELETYLEIKKLSSATQYLAWVDISRQQVYIFKKEAGSLKLYKTMKCSTGSNISPTTRGTFTIKRDRGSWFYSPAARSGAKYWVRFNGVYLFHSIAFDSRQRIYDPTLGKRVSSGCVRLSLEDSKWIYDNFKEGTTVYVN